MEMEEIIKSLEMSLKWEDEFIMNYDTEVVWELFKSLGKDKFEKVKPLLEENIRDSERHSKAIKSLVEKMRSR
ncbi:MAG: hypothetical protein KAS32_15305 [Candidatus Peribacteraceae bacterium]|nr:hypothetical protein [Candidatus Peribacteraceae bacterium]